MAAGIPSSNAPREKLSNIARAIQILAAIYDTRRILLMCGLDISDIAIAIGSALPK
jgi:hypothetical protein